MNKLAITMLTLSSVLGLLTSCLDDSGYTDIINSADNSPVVSFYGKQQGLYASAVPLSESEPVTLTITAARANSDLIVNINVQSSTVIDDYNNTLKKAAIAAGDTLDDGTAVYTPFYMLPDSVYNIPSSSISIPKDTLDVKFIFNVNSSKMSLDYNYILPLEIESVAGDSRAKVASNLNSVLSYVQVKNRFDGIYTITGSMVDNTSSSLTGYYPWKVKLVTTGANQVLLYDAENIIGSDPGHVIKSGDAFSLYGEFGLIINLDVNNNVVSVANYYGDPSPTRARAAVLDPSGENKWDPTTKLLKIKYWMYQGGSPRTSFNETFTYVGPR